VSGDVEGRRDQGKDTRLLLHKKHRSSHIVQALFVHRFGTGTTSFVRRIPTLIDIPTLFQAAILGNTTAIMDQDLEQKHHHAQEVEHDEVYSEKTAAAENKAGAIEAENIEHNMTVLEAVKAYPMASFWAFVMSCTIVSPLSISRFEGCND
jgi:hypothetical protein